MGIRCGDNASRGKVGERVVTWIERAEVVTDFETIGRSAVFRVGVTRVGAVEEFVAIFQAVEVWILARIRHVGVGAVEDFPRIGQAVAVGVSLAIS